MESMPDPAGHNEGVLLSYSELVLSTKKGGVFGVSQCREQRDKSCSSMCRRNRDV